MVAYRVGYCCCNTTVFKSVSMVFHHTPGNPNSKITSADLTLYYYESNSTHAEDITFDVDISPLNGKSVPEMWNQDWTLKLLIDGEEAGRVVYHFVSGGSQSNFVVNLTVYFAGYVYRAENCTAQETPLSGLAILRHACTRTPIP